MPILYKNCIILYENYNKNRRGKPLKAKAHLFTQISTSFLDENWPLFRYKKVKDKNKYIILMVSITLW